MYLLSNARREKGGDRNIICKRQREEKRRRGGGRNTPLHSSKSLRGGGSGSPQSLSPREEEEGKKKREEKKKDMIKYSLYTNDKPMAEKKKLGGDPSALNIPTHRGGGGGGGGESEQLLFSGQKKKGGIKRKRGNFPTPLVQECIPKRGRVPCLTLFKTREEEKEGENRHTLPSEEKDDVMGLRLI